MSWDAHADSWENEATRAYAEAAFQSLERFCTAHQRPLDDVRVCDFGCGTGLLTERLAPLAATVVAVDSSSAMIDVLKTKVADRGLDNVIPLALQLDEKAVASETSFAEPFDLVVCSSVCAFLDDYPATTKLLAKLLAPGGLFVQWDWEIDPDSAEPFGLTHAQVRTTLDAARLEILALETAFSISVDGKRMAPLMGIGMRR